MIRCGGWPGISSSALTSGEGCPRRSASAADTLRATASEWYSFELWQVTRIADGLSGGQEAFPGQAGGPFLEFGEAGGVKKVAQAGPGCGWRCAGAGWRGKLQPGRL